MYVLNVSLDSSNLNLFSGSGKCDILWLTVCSVALSAGKCCYIPSSCGIIRYFVIVVSVWFLKRIAYTEGHSVVTANNIVRILAITCTLVCKFSKVQCLIQEQQILTWYKIIDFINTNELLRKNMISSHVKITF